MTAGSSSPTPPATFHADVVVLPPAWRAVAGALKVFARGSLLMIVAALWFSDNPPTNPLAQMRMFAGLFLAPEAAAWCVARAFAARLRLDNGTLTLDQRARRTEIRVTALAAVEPWRVPLPGVGVSLRLDTGERFADGIVLADVAGLVDALRTQGGTPSLADGLNSPAAAYARARRASRSRILDHPALKFVLFPLVPAVPAFRLHQYITYGGPFGEYQTFGLRAYLAAFAIWWASWAIGLVLFAAVLRAAVEVATLLLLAVVPARVTPARRGLEVFDRILFYVGVPAGLLIRLWPW